MYNVEALSFISYKIVYPLYLYRYVTNPDTIGCILVLGSADVMLRGGCGMILKQGLLVHSEQIVKCGGGHWISPLR